MWREEVGWDYEDDRQSRSYPRLSGSARSSSRTRGQPSTEMIIPELSQMSDEEFHHRLIAMRRQHAETMAMCDDIGLGEGQDGRQHCGQRGSKHMPIAKIDMDCTLSTPWHANRSPPPGSTDYVGRSFRSSKSPPSTRRTSWHESGQLNEATREIKSKKLEAVRRRAGDEENMRMHRMQEYIDENVDLNEGRDLDSCSAHGCRPTSAASRSTHDHSSQHLHSRDHTRTHSGNKSLSPLPLRFSSAHNNQWQNSITIPKPFQMTIREETHSPEKSKTVREYETQNAERGRWEEWHRRYKFKALPLPANTYLPMYEVLNDKKEQRRSGIHAQRREILKAMQEPFSFDDRERNKKVARHQVVTKLEKFERLPDGEFKAKPFPRKMFDETTYERMKEEEEVRRVEAEQRSDYMLRTSYLNPNMKIKLKGHVCSMTGSRLWERPESRQTVHVETRGAYHRNKEVNHLHYQGHLSTAAGRSTDRHCSKEHSGENSFHDDIESDEEMGSGARWPNTNLGSNHQSRSHSNLSSCSSGYSSPASTNRNHAYRNQWTAEMEDQLAQLEAEEMRRQKQREVGNTVTGAKLLTTTRPTKMY